MKSFASLFTARVPERPSEPTTALPLLHRSAAGWRSSCPFHPSLDSSRPPGNHRLGRPRQTTTVKTQGGPPETGRTSVTGALASFLAFSSCSFLPFRFSLSTKQPTFHLSLGVV